MRHAMGDRAVTVNVSGRRWKLLLIPRVFIVLLLRTRIEGRTTRWSLHYATRWTDRRELILWEYKKRTR